MSIEMYKIGLSEAWKNLLSGKVGNAHPTLRAIAYGFTRS